MYNVAIGSTVGVLDLYETIDQLVMAVFIGMVMCCGEDGHVLRWTLDFEVEGHTKNGRPKRTWKRQVEEEGVKVGLSREDTLC